MPRRRPLLSALLFSMLATPLAAQPAAPGSGRVEGAEALNVRSGPGLEHGVVGALRRGDAVEVREIDDKWARVRYRDGEGWVFAGFVTVDATAVATPTTTPVAPTPAASSAGTPGAAADAAAPGVPGGAELAADEAPATFAGVAVVDEIRGDVDRILTLTEAMHHELERQRNSPPTAPGSGGISVQSGVGLLALGAVIGLLVGTILGRQQERRGRPRVRL